MEDEVRLSLGDDSRQWEMLNREIADHIAPEKVRDPMLIGWSLRLVEINEFGCLRLELNLVFDQSVSLIERQWVEELIVESPLVKFHIDKSTD
ncbi:MAG: hypothetical protein LMBGKNDO_00818 [Bacteroidales bacterium]|nr:hypothetical protein [Bacteroidales bacterium]